MCAVQQRSVRLGDANGRSKIREGRHLIERDPPGGTSGVGGFKPQDGGRTCSRKGQAAVFPYEGSGGRGVRERGSNHCFVNLDDHAGSQSGGVPVGGIGEAHAVGLSGDGREGLGHRARSASVEIDGLGTISRIPERRADVVNGIAADRPARNRGRFAEVRVEIRTGDGRSLETAVRNDISRDGQHALQLIV